MGGDVVSVELDPLDGGGSGVQQPGGFGVEFLAPPRRQHDLARAAADEPLRDREADFTAATQYQHCSRHAPKSARR